LQRDLASCATRYTSQFMRSLVVFPILSLTLLACPPKEQAPANPTPPPEMPATKPATGTSTTSMKGADPVERDQMDADGVVRRGVELSAAKPLSVREVVAQADGLAGKSVKVTGKVGSVCTKKGCWFVIQDGEQTIRITAKDYGFFVPSKATGMLATVEGELTVKMLDDAAKKHLESEGAAPKADKEVEIAAAALEMKHSG
jgi:hypothetical protein